MLALSLLVSTFSLASADPVTQVTPAVHPLLEQSLRIELVARDAGALEELGAKPPDVTLEPSATADLFKAPVPPKWPDDTPAPTQQEGGWFVPDVTARLLVRDARYYPVACQAAMDAERKFFEDRAKINLDLSRANEQSREAELRVQASRGWRWYQVTAVVVGTAAGAFALGYLYRDLH